MPEAKHQKKTVSVSDERFRLVVGSVRDYAIFLLDPQGIVASWNAGAERIHGAKEDEIISRHFSVLYTPEDNEKHIPDTELETASRQGRADDSRWLVRKDGTCFWAEGATTAITDESSNLQGFLKVFQDATQRLLAEEALRTSEERLRRAALDAPLPIMIHAENGEVLLINKVWTELTGYSADEIPTISAWVDKAFREKKDEIRAEIQELYSLESRAKQGEAVIITKRGEERIWDFTSSGLGKLPDGTRMVISMAMDVTERKHLEEQFRQSHKLESLGILAGGIAHDFNNLLTTIMGNASLALSSLPPEDKTRSLLESTIRAAQQAAALTQQMLAYSGKGRFVVKPVDIAELVREIVSLLHASIPKKVSLVLNLQSDLPPVEADASQIQQLVMNLVINGAEAIGEKTGTVSVTVRSQDVDESYIEVFETSEITPGKYVCLEVQDTGAGMDEATKSRIFDPFFSTKFTGRGLGLAAVLGIVRGHKGAIKVYSSVGQGSSFKVVLPVAAGQPATAQREVTPQDLQCTGTILVVDDEQAVRRTAQAALERYGYTVLVAEHGQAAVEVFQKMANRISLVFLDVTMPILSGEETIRHLQKIRPDVRVIASSGYHEIEVMKRFGGEKLAGFIQKPYTAMQLAEKVKAVLDG